MVGVTLSVEARYAAVSRLIRTEGCTNLLDVACGYTPRAIFCEREGVDYVGLDVPVVAEELNRAAPGLASGTPIPCMWEEAPRMRRLWPLRQTFWMVSC
jgi:hypothetical protein